MSMPREFEHHGAGAEQAQCAKSAEPNPTTVDDLLIQKISRLMGEVHHLIRVRMNLPFSVRKSAARDIRELAQLL
jgi:hypothetical protein